MKTLINTIRDMTALPLFYASMVFGFLAGFVASDRLNEEWDEQLQKMEDEDE